MNCLSLYTGCGGLDLGFQAAGFSTVWANELSKDALATYKGELQRIRTTIPELICGDISSVELPAKGSADIVIGGPPCQGFSVAGRMDPNDPRSRHVWEFFRVVKHIQPTAFVMENVKALAVNKRWEETRKALQQEGERLGFQTKLLVLNAADFGVPQLRERMFLVGIKGKTISSPARRNVTTSVREALKKLPPHGSDGNHSLCQAIVTPAKSPVLRKSPFAGMLFNGQGRPMNLDAPSPTLPASMGGNRTPIIDQRTLEKGSVPWIVKYHQSLMNGGNIAKSIPSRLRRLTVEEAAVIQGFPVGMQFEGSQCAKFRQIGNSVPPPLAEAVAITLKNTIEGKYQATEIVDGQHAWVAEDPAEYATK